MRNKDQAGGYGSASAFAEMQRKKRKRRAFPLEVKESTPEGEK
jgi:hypothetical protein